MQPKYALLRALKWTVQPPGLPGVGIGSFATQTRPDLIEPPERIFQEGDFQRLQASGELLPGAWPDDRGRDNRGVEQPGQRDRSRLLPELLAECLVLIEA